MIVEGLLEVQGELVRDHLKLQRAAVILLKPNALYHNHILLQACHDIRDAVLIDQHVHGRLGYVSPLLTRLLLPLKSEAAGSLEPAGAKG